MPQYLEIHFPLFDKYMFNSKARSLSFFTLYLTDIDITWILMKIRVNELKPYENIKRMVYPDPIRGTLSLQLCDN